MGPLNEEEPHLPRQEAEEFVSRVLQIDLPPSYPPNLLWINQLIQAFQQKLPFQNISLMSQDSHTSVPTWEDIYQEIIVNGKGGLCLSLNVALATVLAALGITAYNAAANYVALNATGVHAVTLFHLSDTPELKKHCKSRVITRRESRLLKNTSSSYHVERVEENKELDIYFTNASKDFKHRRQQNIEKVPESCLYLADVGCGYPTLQAINLKKDLKKVFIHCGLEYCIIKEARHFERMHRRGHELDEIEKECLTEEGWLPMFSFNTIPRSISFFQRSMRCIYIDKNQSPYFSELHAVLYFDAQKMVALKNEQLIKGFGSAVEVSLPSSHSDLENNESDEVKHLMIGNREKLKQTEVSQVLFKNFPMIPRQEVEKAVIDYFLQKNV